MADKKRIEILDFIKGILIFLVILGHVVELLDGNNFYENIVYKIIYSFHMPLFMIVSGYLFYNSIKKYSLKEIIKKKTKKILIPALFFGLLYSIIVIIINKKIDIILFINNIIGLWFLYAVYILSLVFGIVNKKFKDSNVIYMILFVISFFIPFFGPFVYMYQFFLIGYLINKYSLNLKVNIWLIILSLIIFGCSIWFYSEKTFVDVSGNFILNNNYKMIHIMINRFIASLSGSYLLYAICKNCVSFRKCELAYHLGKNSIYIYVIHFVLIDYFIKNFNFSININGTFLLLVVAFFVSFLLTVLCYYANKLLLKTKFYNYIFGNY